VKIALGGGMKPLECDVLIDGKPQGVYKGKSGEHLQRIIALRMEESGIKGSAEVREKPAAVSEPTPDGAASAPVEPSAAPVATPVEQPVQQ